MCTRHVTLFSNTLGGYSIPQIEGVFDARMARLVRVVLDGLGCTLDVGEGDETATASSNGSRSVLQQQ